MLLRCADDGTGVIVILPNFACLTLVPPRVLTAVSPPSTSMLTAQRIQLQAGPLQVLATRYTPDDARPNASLTLILLHGLGSHKETWEPLLAHLLARPEGRNILEVYSIENPNHGESALVNSDVLETDAYRNTCTSIPARLRRVSLRRALECLHGGGTRLPDRRHERRRPSRLPDSTPRGHRPLPRRHRAVRRASLCFVRSLTIR